MGQRLSRSTRAQRHGLEGSEEPPDLVVVADEKKLHPIACATEDDTVGESSSNFPEALVKMLQAKSKGKLPFVKGLDEAIHSSLRSPHALRIEALQAPFEAWNELVAHAEVLAPAGQ